MRTESCVVIDLYQYPVACGTPDPCAADGLTVWRAMDCTYGVDYSLPEFCAMYDTHPVCLALPPTVPVPPVLPPTGGGVLARVALLVVMVGVALVRVGTRKDPRRGQHVRGGGPYGTRG